MSFLGDLVNSIGSNKAPVLPKPAQRTPITSSAAHSNPAPRPKPVPGTSTPPIIGQKRKLDERDLNAIKPADRGVKSNPAPTPSSKASQKPNIPTPNVTKPAVARSIPVIANTNSSASNKPQTKLSYAEKLARAKEAQQNRGPNQVGTIKHQATSKEKPSKLAERRRQEQEKLSKPGKDKKVDKVKPGMRNDSKRSTSPVKKPETGKVARAARPPLHAPASSTYKGTMGTSAKKSREDRIPKKSRYDEYLGTDEEENSDMDVEEDDDGYGYGSDGSSDMEAGMDDIDLEEATALRAAKADDAKELALENELKREKDERKRRLMAMAKRGR